MTRCRAGANRGSSGQSLIYWQSKKTKPKMGDCPNPVQELTAGVKHKGKLDTTAICGCRFVKLIGKYGYGE